VPAGGDPRRAALGQPPGRHGRHAPRGCLRPGDVCGVAEATRQAVVSCAPRSRQRSPRSSPVLDSAGV